VDADPSDLYIDDPGTDDTIEVPPDESASLVSPVDSTPITDTTAESTRTIPAYLDPDDPDRVVTVFEIRYPARSGSSPRKSSPSNHRTRQIRH
jgi:hypothetical protein